MLEFSIKDIIIFISSSSESVNIIIPRVSDPFIPSISYQSPSSGLSISRPTSPISISHGPLNIAQTIPRKPDKSSLSLVVNTPAIIIMQVSFSISNSQSCIISSLSAANISMFGSSSSPSSNIPI